MAAANAPVLLPSAVPTAAGCEGWPSMYPYFTRFRPEDDRRFWFYNGMHFPEPMPAFDIITAEACYCALGAMTTRVFAIPSALGIDHRIVNGRIYISAMPVTDPQEIERRAAVFQQRAPYYFEHWDELYAQWKQRLTALIADTEAIVVPALPEFEDEAVVMKATGTAQNQGVLEGWHRALENYYKMWQHHFEFLILGYGAYLTFFEFCKKVFPEVEDQTVSRMVAGVDVLMFRPDDELKGLARLAVQCELDDEFVDGRPVAELLAGIAARGEAGARWLAGLERAREPWFNVSAGDGFYHHHRSWNDDMAIPMSALPRYIAELRAGRNLDRPTARLQAERERITAEYRALLANDGDRATFDQLLDLAHLVFPYVEDHKIYCEHWLTMAFYKKVRQFGSLLATHGVLDGAEDLFQLHHTEVAQALSDLSLSWSAGTPPRGKAHWGPVVAQRRALLVQMAQWQPPASLGPIPEVINDPLLNMLWGITSEQLTMWSTPPASDDELRGFAASPGVAEGLARVVHRVEDIGSVREGEILVCPVTAPSWAPIFGKIRAAVSDIGGTMSHAAIVAREYGMPAVVGTGHGTRVIKTGQRLRVDGHAGRVTVLPG